MHRIKNFDKLLCYNTIIIIIIIFALSLRICLFAYVFLLLTEQSREHAHMVHSTSTKWSHLLNYYYYYFHFLDHCADVLTVCMRCGQKKEFAQELKSSRALLRSTIEPSAHNGIAVPSAWYLFIFATCKFSWFVVWLVHPGLTTFRFNGLIVWILSAIIIFAFIHSMSHNGFILGSVTAPCARLTTMMLSIFLTFQLFTVRTVKPIFSINFKAVTTLLDECPHTAKKEKKTNSHL